MHHLHRSRLVHVFDSSQKSLIYLKGAQVTFRHNTDHELVFRQESNFLYLTGIQEPDYSCLLDIQTGEYTLFSPFRDTQYAVWHGYITPQESIKKAYQPDMLLYSTEFESFLKKKAPQMVYCFDETQAKDIEQFGFKTNTESLIPALTDCRLCKTEWELDQMRYANKITSEAHRAVLEAIRPGLKEYDIKRIFEEVGGKYNLFQQAYQGIYAAGKNAAVLHYTGREDELKSGDLFLIDAGLEYNGYAADFTRSYPVNGKFTDIQAAVYQACLDAHLQTIDAVKPGVKMEDLHYMAAQIILNGLKKAGLIEGEMEELMEANVFALFFPHGLGHLIGIDTHDVGGYKKGVERIDRPGIRYLRVRRELEPGMVITIEPGVYFIPALLEPAFKDQFVKRYLNESKLRSLYDFGGVRIEDNIVVTKTGYENMTSVPKTIAEIEHVMQS